MSVISTTPGTKRLTAKLAKAGINLWVAKASGDAWGKYLLFEVGGKCVAGAGWTLAEAAAKVEHKIKYKDCDNPPPFEG